MNKKAGLFLNKGLFFLAAILFCGWIQACENTGLPVVLLADLPLEVAQTLALAKKGGPFPYARDRAVFRNYEKHLPIKKRGYYREYTVKTPSVRGRGARRLVVGNYFELSPEYYYTNDHYVSFQCIKE